MAVLVGTQQPNAQPFDRLPQQDGAPALIPQRIGVLDTRSDVINVTVLVPVKTDDAQPERVGDERNVDHAVVALAEAATIGRLAEVDESGCIVVRGGRGCASGMRSAPEQREPDPNSSALRSAEEFDALDVEHRV